MKGEEREGDEREKMKVKKRDWCGERKLEWGKRWCQGGRSSHIIDPSQGDT